MSLLVDFRSALLSPSFRMATTGEISSFVLDLTASRNIQASLFFKNALLFLAQVGCTGFPYDLGYYALVIGPWTENRGNTNGLPWLGGLRTSMWKGEINQANRPFSPDHRTEPIEAPQRLLFSIVARSFVVTSLKNSGISYKINFMKNYIRADLQYLKSII